MRQVSNDGEEEKAWVSPQHYKFHIELPVLDATNFKSSYTYSDLLSDVLTDGLHPETLLISVI